MFWIVSFLAALSCVFARLGSLMVITKVLGIALLATAVAFVLVTTLAGVLAWRRRGR